MKKTEGSKVLKSNVSVGEKAKADSEVKGLVKLVTDDAYDVVEQMADDAIRDNRSLVRMSSHDTYDVQDMIKDLVIQKIQARLGEPR